MDTAWTTFIEKQKALAVQNDITLKRQAAKLYALEKREGVLTPEQVKAAAQLPWDHEKSILNTRQYDLITDKHKNEKMNGYYLLRDQDKALQNYCNYEAENDMQEDFESMSRKRDCILDILRILKDLGFPSNDLQQYVTENNIRSAAEIAASFSMSLEQKNPDLSTAQKSGRKGGKKSARAGSSERV